MRTRLGRGLTGCCAAAVCCDRDQGHRGQRAGGRIYLDPAVHGRGLGADAVRTLARHLISDHGHHRLEIDPAADNGAAIRCYANVGFRPVGIRRRSERGPDGAGHDALLVDLLAEELVEEQDAISSGSGNQRPLPQ